MNSTSILQILYVDSSISCRLATVLGNWSHARPHCAILPASSMLRKLHLQPVRTCLSRGQYPSQGVILAQIRGGLQEIPLPFVCFGQPSHPSPGALSSPSAVLRPKAGWRAAASRRTDY